MPLFLLPSFFLFFIVWARYVNIQCILLLFGNSMASSQTATLYLSSCNIEGFTTKNIINFYFDKIYLDNIYHSILRVYLKVIPQIFLRKLLRIQGDIYFSYFIFPFLLQGRLVRACLISRCLRQNYSDSPWLL
jgi:hypothetical protein